MIDFVKKSNLIIFILTIAFFIFFYLNSNNLYKLPTKIFKINLKFELYDNPNEELINIIETINNELISTASQSLTNFSQTYRYKILQNDFINAVDLIIKSPYADNLAKVKYLELKKQLNQEITDLDNKFSIKYLFFDSLGYPISSDNLFGNKYTLDITFISLDDEEKDNILSNYLLEIINQQLEYVIETETNNMSHNILFNYRQNYMYEKLLKKSSGLTNSIDINKSYINIENQSKKLKSLLLKFKHSARNQFYLDLNKNGEIVKYFDNTSIFFNETLKFLYVIFSTFVVFVFLNFFSFFLKFFLKK